jgi:cell division septum initiation protein DivIVA
MTKFGYNFYVTFDNSINLFTISNDDAQIRIMAKDIRDVAELLTRIADQYEKEKEEDEKLDKDIALLQEQIETLKSQKRFTKCLSMADESKKKDRAKHSYPKVDENKNSVDFRDNYTYRG